MSSRGHTLAKSEGIEPFILVNSCQVKSSSSSHPINSPWVKSGYPPQIRRYKALPLVNSPPGQVGDASSTHVNSLHVKSGHPSQSRGIKPSTLSTLRQCQVGALHASQLINTPSVPIMRSLSSVSSQVHFPFTYCSTCISSHVIYVCTLSNY